MARTLHYLTPYALLAFAGIWSLPLYHAWSMELALSERMSLLAFSDTRIVQGIIWPAVFASLHLVSALAYVFRAHAPRFAFLSYILLFLFMTGVAFFYFVAHGFSLATTPLPFVIAVNLPPLALIIYFAHRARPRMQYDF